MNFTNHNLNSFEDKPIAADSNSISLLIPMLYSLGLGGAIISAVYFILTLFREQLTKMFISSITVENDDQMFKWLQLYLSEQKLMQASLTNVTACLEKCKLQRWWEQSDNKADDYKEDIQYKPSGGFHKFNYKNTTIFIRHTVGQTITVGYERKPQKIESICMQISIPNMNGCALGNRSKGKKPRTFDSVILDKDQANEVIQDVQMFMQSQKWYIDRGVPYRRGYLLYGPPGTGKTSFILAIAGQLGLKICPLNLSGNDLDDDSLNRLLEKTPKKSLILLEDVDAIFVDRTSVQTEHRGRHVSFSGLLNALDGVRSQEGRILFMTTNHKEKLDEALLRPGRADVHIQLNHASELQTQRLFLKFFPGQDELATKFSQSIPEHKISMAKLQGHFVRYKNTPELTIEKVDELLDQEVFNQEMTINEWLFRLGLEQYAHAFIKDDIKRISDLKDIGESQLEKYGIQTTGLKKKVTGVITGIGKYVVQFKLMSSNQVRGFVQMCVADKEIQQKIIKEIPADTVTQFQLRKIFDEHHKEEEIMTHLKKLLKKCKRLQNGKQLKQEIEVEEEKPKVSFDIDIPKILEQSGLKKYLPTFIEQNMDKDTDLFLELNEGDLERFMKIENYGQRKKLLKLIQELNKKRELKQKLFEAGIKRNDEQSSEDEPDLKLSKSYSCVSQKNITY